MEKVNLFISYSHGDKDDLDTLRDYINEKNCPNTNVWYDGKISLGTVWDEKIKQRLNDAHIVLLFISQKFLNSMYINNVELKTALEKNKNGLCKIIPVFAKTCDLEAHPELLNLQGFPSDKRFFCDMGNEKFKQYTLLQKLINELANEILMEANGYSSTTQNDDLVDIAKELDYLRNNKKLYLSIPNSEEAKEIRTSFLYEVERKIKYESWRYEIIPGINEIEDFYKKDNDEKKDFISKFQKEASYSIHIITSEECFEDGVDKLQYDLAIKNASPYCLYKKIIWIIKPEVRAKIDKMVLMNPIVSGNDFQSIFEKIKCLDEEKEKKITELKKYFNSGKKVFMFYDFDKDHNNELRIRLKTMIEENENVDVRFSLPNAPLEKDKEDLEKCEGGLIFYGKTDPYWFAMRQAILMDSPKTQSKCICIDEPEIEEKVKRDVIKRPFTIIKGSADLETGMKSFWDSLQR